MSKVRLSARSGMNKKIAASENCVASRFLTTYACSKVTGYSMHLVRLDIPSFLPSGRMVCFVGTVLFLLLFGIYFRFTGLYDIMACSTGSGRNLTLYQ